MFTLAGWALTLLIILNTTNLSPVKIPKEINIPVINPSSTPTITPSPTPTPTSTPTPSPTPTVTPVPTKPPPTPTTEKPKEETMVNPPAGDIPLQLMKQINDFRAGKGLPAFTTDGYTCGFAVLRAGEIAGSFSHDGFRNRIDSKTLPYPSYTGVSENIAMNSDSNAVVQGWIDSPGHNENLSRSHQHACVGKSGNYYTFESWNP